MRHNKWLLLYGLLACSFLYMIEQGIGVSYAIKAGFKIVLFLCVPLVFMQKAGHDSLREILGLDHIDLKDVNMGIKIGLIAFGVLIALGVFFAPTIDFDSIRQELSEKLHVTVRSFIFVGLYITFVNSLLEELFFRGFLYGFLKRSGWSTVAMFFSSLLFGVYHMAMFQTWLSPGLVILCVIGLIIVGIFFNYINNKTSTFLNSWIIHIIADSAIMLFAFKMLYM